MRHIHCLFIGIIALICFVSCKEKKQVYDLKQIQEVGELRVVTLSTSTSYFIYKEDTMGYDYEMARNFCDSLGVNLNIIVAENYERMLKMLYSGEADLIAYPIMVSNEMKDSLIFSGPEQISRQVLVQRANKGDTLLTDQSELVGKDVYTLKNSKYYQRLENFNQEIGGGINIISIDTDTITEEDLIGMVSEGRIKYTVSDEILAKVNKTYHNNINISLPMSFDQRSSWAVSVRTPQLAKALNKWVSKYDRTPTYQTVTKKYFEVSKQPLSAYYEIPKGLPKGAISPYDSLFVKHARGTNYDWHLLAAISYNESRFKNNLTSWAGAAGIMGLMPRTARSLGLTDEERMDPDKSIGAAVVLLDRLNVIFKKIDDKEERLKFILAAYNGGDGHIRDAQRLASKYGANPDIWYDNVRTYVLLKSNPEYYNDPVCKNGYFRGTETTKYVDDVLAAEKRFKAGK